LRIYQQRWRMNQLVIVYQLIWHNISEDMHCNMSCLSNSTQKKDKHKKSVSWCSLSFKGHKNYCCARVQQRYIVRISKFWKIDNSKVTDASLSPTKNSLSLDITFWNIVMHFILRHYYITIFCSALPQTQLL